MQPDAHAHLAPTEHADITLADIEAVAPYSEVFELTCCGLTDPDISLLWLLNHGYTMVTPVDEINRAEEYFRSLEEYHSQSLYKLPRTELSWKAAFNMTSSIEQYKQQLQLNPEEIKAKHPLQEVAKNYTKLTKKGKEWSGCCPIHHEKTPSFSVSESKQMWYCFGGCARGGDVIDLVMLVENITFKEALKHLSAH